MKTRWVKRLLLATGCILFAGLGLAIWYLGQFGPVGSGFVAKRLCSGIFVSGRVPDLVFEKDVKPANPLAGYFIYTIDRQRKRVTASLQGLYEKTAIWRHGCGCTVVAGISEPQMRRQLLVAPGFTATLPRRRSDEPWPQGNGGPLEPATLGIDAAKLDRVLDQAFAEPGPEHLRNTRAVILVYKGRLIAERYAQGVNKDTPLLGWSMSKSITNALLGILVRQGKLDIMSPAPVPQWQADHSKRRITVDHLLRMSSGLAFDEIYQPLSDTVRMLYGSHDFGAYASGKPLEAAPGTRWLYSSGTTNILAGIVRRTVQSAYPHYLHFVYKELFHRIGMYSAVMEPDASGSFVGSSYTLATPLDWARFGLLYLQDGIWEGDRILPEGWIEYTVTPTAHAPKGKYGAHFWLNAGEATAPEQRMWPSAPRDTFAALGYQEQQLFVIPSRNTVLVRFGATADRKRWNADDFLRQMLAVLPNN